MTVLEPTMIGVSKLTHVKLTRLKEDGHFKEMADAYRFAIGLALAQGIVPDEISSQTVFSVSTIDPHQIIRNAITAILGQQIAGKSVYKMAERLADWGIQEMFAQASNGSIDFVKIFDQLEGPGDET